MNGEDDISLGSIKRLFVPLTNAKAITWIITISFVVFCNSLFNGFVGDDQAQIVANPLVHSLRNFLLLFSGSTFYNGSQQAMIGQYYRPLTSVWSMLIAVSLGTYAIAYHFFQILLAITDASLVYFLFQKYFSKYIAFFLALVFLVHPINSEAAFYISDTQENLFFFFGMVALLIFLSVQSKKTVLLTPFFLLLSLLSKETGILFVVILLLTAFFYKRRIFFPLLRNIIIVVLVYALLRFVAIGLWYHGIPNAPIEKANVFARLLNVPAIVFHYLSTFFFPRDLSESYTWVYTYPDIAHFWIPLVVDILFFLALFSLLWIVHKKFLRKVFQTYLFFTVWFVLGLLLHMQFIPLDATVADGWFYFPIVGLLGVIGTLFASWHPSSWQKKIAGVLMIGIILLLSWRTILRSFDFRDDMTLVKHDLNVSQSYTLELLLSYAYFEKGDYQHAKEHAEKSIALFPYETNYQNLGTADFYLGDYAGARTADFQALRYGESQTVYDNLGSLTLLSGDEKDNRALLQQALRKFSFDALLWRDLALFEYKYGHTDVAKNDITQAFHLNSSQEIYSAYMTIMNNEPLRIRASPGDNQ